MKYNIGDIVPFEQTQEATAWVNSVEGNYYLKDYERDKNGNMQLIVCQLPQPTEAELAERALVHAKAIRAEAVEKIIVEVDGMKFDGDEVSQTRMGRTIAAAIALGVDIQTYTQIWVLADNTVANVTVAQLAQALKLSGEAQTALWTMPYEG